MEMKWPFFAGAGFLAAMILLAYGAPISAVAAGIGFAAMWNWSKRRIAARAVRRK
jgi:hypothetical protein